MLILSEKDVNDMVSMPQAIQAVEAGLLAEARDQAETLQKHVLPYDEGERALHVLAAVAPGLGVSGVKIWVQHHAVAHPMVVVFNSQTAAPLAMIEANVLSNLRTGALAGVATKYLASPDASVLGVIGSGKQARTLVQAVAAVRPLTELRVWSPSTENRTQFAETMGQELGIRAVASPSVQDALDQANIVGLAARVPTPVVDSTMIARGAHVNSIGTTVSGKSELPVDVFPRFDKVCADSLASVRTLSEEFRAYYEEGNGDWNEVKRLADVVSTKYSRPVDADLTLYKGMGTGIADLAMAAFILEKAGILLGQAD